VYGLFQQQLEGICIELEAANSKGNSRQLFQIVKSVTRKFHPRLPGIQSATGESLTEAAQIADRWKGYCEGLYCDKEGKGIEQEYLEQEPPPLRSDVARAIRQTASRKATGPDEVPAKLFKAGGETVLDRMHRICVALSGKLVSGQRNGRSPCSSNFPRKAILNSVQITEQLLLFPKQARSFFGSYWKGSE